MTKCGASVSEVRAHYPSGVYPVHFKVDSKLDEAFENLDPAFIWPFSNLHVLPWAPKNSKIDNKEPYLDAHFAEVLI